MISLLIMLAAFTVQTRAGSIIVINGSTDYKQKNFTIGTDLQVEISGEADSVSMMMDNIPVALSQRTAIIPTTHMRMGEHAMRAYSYHNGAVTDTTERKYTLVSDIVPVSDTFDIVNIFPHDTLSFTQGLIYYKGSLYEGTGLKGRSKLMRIELSTGRALQTHELHKNFFGEGIVLLNEKIYQITWKNKLGLIYDRNSFAYLKGFNYPWDGWGITTDGRKLFISTGSSRIYILDPERLKVEDSIDVCDDKGSIKLLNEQEMIDGDIYANVLGANYIVRINPQTGKVKSVLNLAGLRKELSATNRRYPELNGIAYDPESGRIFVTGKLWPKLFEIRRKLHP